MREREDRPLVGREPERAAAAAALAAGRGVLLVGEAGIGKSRLARALAEEVEASERRVVAVHATASLSATPLGALAGAFRPHEQTDLRADLLAQAQDAVRAAVEPGGLVLADDAHLLDEATAAVLAGVARAGGPLLLTARAGERLPDALAQLWQGDLVDRIDLAALPADDGARLLAVLVGGPPDEATERRLLDAAAGNPMFLRELVLAGREAGDLALVEGRWHLAGDVRPGRRLVDLVERRLEGLPAKERLAVDLLALASSLELDLLEGATSPTAVEAIDALGFLRVDEGGPAPMVGLHHPIYGEVLRAALPALRRRRLYDRLATDLAARGERGEGDHLRLARWSLEAGRDAGPDVLRAGARQALLAHDHDLAARLAEAAAQAGAGVPAVLLHAEALAQAERRAEADRLLSACTPETPDEHAIVASQQANVRFWGLDDPVGAQEVLDRAAAVLDGDHAAEVTALAAQLEQMGGRPAAALARVEPVLVAAGAEEGRTFVHAANAAMPALAVVGRVEEALALVDRTKAAWERLGSQLAVFDPGILLASAALGLMELGRLDEAREVTTFGRELAIDHRSSNGQAWMALCGARVALWQGDLDAARDGFAEGRRVAAPSLPGLARWGVGGGLEVAAQRRDLAAVAELEAALDDAPASALKMLDGEVDSARGWAAAVQGRTAEAVDRFVAAYERERDAGARVLAVAVAHEGFRATGAPVVDPVAVVALAGATDSPFVQARAEHVRAGAACDGPGLEAVAEAFERFGARLLAAEAWTGASGAWRRSSEGRRANRAATAAAAARSGVVGADTPLLRAVGEATPLTAREREAIELARLGLATKEIAARMGVRPRTAENHLYRAYDKLGITGKADLDA